MKYSDGAASTSSGCPGVATKFVNTLKNHDVLRDDFCDGRFCFVFGGMRRLSYEDEPDTMRGKYVEEILRKLKEAKLTRLAELDDYALETKIQECLILLTREHLKYLMTPSLSDRAQFHRKKKRKREKINWSVKLS